MMVLVALAGIAALVALVPGRGVVDVPEPPSPLSTEQLEWTRECALRDPGTGPDWIGVCKRRARVLFPVEL